MLQALVVVPDGSGPGGADGRDLAALLTMPDELRDGLSITVATPTGQTATVDETTLAWVKQESEEDWAYLASLGERARPNLAALSDGDVRSLGLLVCRSLRDRLVAAGAPRALVESVLFQAVQRARAQLAPFDEVFLKACEEEPALAGVDAHVCQGEVRAAIEDHGRQRATDIRSTLDGPGPFANAVSLEEALATGGWDVILVPGGGEQVEALGSDSRVGALMGSVRRAGAPVGVIGAGAAALLSVDDGVDGWIFDGIVVVAPPDPSYSFLADRTWSDRSVRNRLLRRGAIVDEAGPSWGSRVSESRGVVSGRNCRCAPAVWASIITQARRPR